MHFFLQGFLYYKIADQDRNINIKKWYLSIGLNDFGPRLEVVDAMFVRRCDVRSDVRCHVCSDVRFKVMFPMSCWYADIRLKSFKSRNNFGSRMSPIYAEARKFSNWFHEKIGVKFQIRRKRKSQNIFLK